MSFERSPATPSFTIAKHQEQEFWVPSQGAYWLSFTAAVGTFNRRFVSNIRVDSLRDKKGIRIQLAIDKSKPEFSSFVHEANSVGTRQDANIELMRHSLLDFNELPANKEQPVITNMSRLALAHTIGAANLYERGRPGLLIPIGFAFERFIRQQEAELHERIYAVAKTGGELARSDTAA